MIARLASTSIPDLLPMRDRSPGTHVSDVIHKLAVSLGHYDDGRDLNVTRLQLGCALEWAVIQRYQADEPARYVQPGELELDGLFGTPDLLDTIGWGSGDVVDEIKLTWASANNPPCVPVPGSSDGLWQPTKGAGWRYFSQLKAYCKMWGTRCGRLHVGYVNGDHTRPFEPQYKVWECEFSDKELDDNWRMLLNNR